MSRAVPLLPILMLLALTACAGGGGGGAGGGGADAGKALFTAKGCVGCHTLASVPGAAAQVGPRLDGIGTAAGTRKPGMSAEAYIRESVADPQATIAPGFTAPSPMPAGLATGKELDDLVAFLLTQR